MIAIMHVCMQVRPADVNDPALLAAPIARPTDPPAYSRVQPPRQKTPDPARASELVVTTAGAVFEVGWTCAGVSVPVNATRLVAFASVCCYMFVHKVSSSARSATSEKKWKENGKLGPDLSRREKASGGETEKASEKASEATDPVRALLAEVTGHL
jgi:hypothetical protein